MIPQLLSSPSPASGRPASPQSGAARDGDGAATGFTLAAEDTAQDLSSGGHAADAFVLAAETVKAQLPAGAVAADGSSTMSSRLQDVGSDAGKASGSLPNGQPPAQPQPNVTTTGVPVPQVTPGGPGAEVAASAQDTKATKAQTLAADIAVAPDARADPRAATQIIPAATAHATSPPPSDRLHRLPTARFAHPFANGAVSTADGPPAGDTPADSVADGRATVTANTGGIVTQPPAAPIDPIAMQTDRNAFVEDAAQAPRDMEIARAETGRADHPARTELARTVGTQVVEAVRHGPAGSIDVALNPEELGRVRLNLMSQDGVLNVTILAERPETHDLLRRNISMLQADFRALGYADVAFDFGPGGDRPGRPSDSMPDVAPRDASDTIVITAAEAAAETPRTTAAATRLDLRL